MATFQTPKNMTAGRQARGTTFAPPVMALAAAAGFVLDAWWRITSLIPRSSTPRH
ncbi:hypothetical protein QMK19_10490 [Streptomyces sp. H10-C2]|uniref:hypothetical protein n=1 Tax=unclassified Streptomyces TaxID=2593676 RepID=UPI0024BB68FB|nr:MULTISPECIES: hypothetical protein [unclassified Streptomyces]MDJ0341938.1 hypothetical protein [Streptomyces sp. PH10-H1]MDJ0369911.1 hypothetical protein [Streptomyces sp. H10-C2]MDJ0370088.1 hypothetical protein [Streptomyces sp. H10-C2]